MSATTGAPESGSAAAEGIAAQAAKPARQWLVLWMLCGIYVLNFLDRQLLSILAKPIQDELHITDGQLGRIGGLYFALFYCFIAIPIGWLADKTNRVTILSIACAIWSAATAACGLAANYAQLVVARMAVGFEVARSIGARRVQRVIERLLAEQRSLGRLGPDQAPAMIRSDNGKEFTSSGLVAWLSAQGITAVQVAKASPQQNCYVERFNGIMRDELLDGELFHSVLESKVVIGRFMDMYNNERPHRGLGMMTPAAFDRAERARDREEDGGCP